MSARSAWFGSHGFRKPEHAIESAPTFMVASTAERFVEERGTVQNSTVHPKIDRRLCPYVSCHLTGKEEYGEERLT